MITETLNNIKSRLGEYPPNYIEDVIDSLPSKGKKLKQLNEAKPAFDKIWKQTLLVLESVRVFSYLQKSVFTAQGIRTLMSEYARLDVELKELSKYIKGSKQIQLVQDYYKGSEKLTDVNLFELMRNDISSQLDTFNYRKVETEKQYNCELEPLDFDRMLPEYKQMVKGYKESRV